METDGTDVFALVAGNYRVVEFAPAPAVVEFAPAPVPAVVFEPASLTLLGLGGLAALARWRIGRLRVKGSTEEQGRKIAALGAVPPIDPFSGRPSALAPGLRAERAWP